MKLVYFFVFILTLVQISCKHSSEPTEKDSDSKTGILKMVMDMSSAPSDVSIIKGSLYRDIDDTLFFDFEISGDSAVAYVENIQSGVWGLVVEASNDEGVLLYSGYTEVFVFPGVLTPVILKLDPTTGSLSITVTWGEQTENQLVGYFPFESSILDLSAALNHGTIFDATFNVGKKDSALQLNGYNQYVEIPYNQIYSSEEKSLSFWFHKDNDTIQETSGTWYVEGLVTKMYDTQSTTPREYAIHLSSAEAPFKLKATLRDDNDIYEDIGTDEIIYPQIWYHVVFIINKSELKLYLNGELVDSKINEASVINTSAPIIIGKEGVTSYSSRYFVGKIDEFRIYNYSLNEAEILELYNIN